MRKKVLLEGPLNTIQFCQAEQFLSDKEEFFGKKKACSKTDILDAALETCLAHHPSSSRWVLNISVITVPEGYKCLMEVTSENPISIVYLFRYLSAIDLFLLSVDAKNMKILSVKAKNMEKTANMGKAMAVPKKKTMRNSARGVKQRGGRTDKTRRNKSAPRTILRNFHPETSIVFKTVIFLVRPLLVSGQVQLPSYVFG